MKVFLYDNLIDLGKGTFARVDGYQLTIMPHTFTVSPEAIKNECKSIYGYVYDVDQSMLEYLDAYYCVSAGIHERRMVPVSVEGGITYQAMMWEYTYAEVAKK